MPNRFMEYMQGSARRLPSVKQDEPIEELTRVALQIAVETEDGVLPAGAKGTVVGVYGRGKAYEVEFTSPFHTVATVMPDAIKR